MVEPCQHYSDCVLKSFLLLEGLQQALMNSYRHIDRWNYIVDGMEKMELWISCMDGWVGGIRCIKGR